MSDKLIIALDNYSEFESQACNVENCAQQISSNKPSNSLMVLNQNICSISSNISQVLLLMARLNTHPDIIVFTECWLSSNTKHTNSYY